MNVAARKSSVVDGKQLADASEIVGSRFRIVAPDLKPEQSAVRGDYRLLRLRDGFILHASDTVELHDLTTEIVQHEGITCSLFLSGEAEVQLGDRVIEFGRRNCTAHVEGVVVSRARRKSSGARVNSASTSEKSMSRSRRNGWKAPV